MTELIKSEIFWRQMMIKFIHLGWLIREVPNSSFLKLMPPITFPLFKILNCRKPFQTPSEGRRMFLSPKLSPSCFFGLFILSNDVTKFIGYILFFLIPSQIRWYWNFCGGFNCSINPFHFIIRIYFFLIKISSRFVCLLLLYIYLIN